MTTTRASVHSGGKDTVPVRAGLVETLVARLPRLLDQRGITDELGVTRAPAEKIMRQVPKVHVAGLGKVYVRRDDVLLLLNEGTRR